MPAVAAGIQSEPRGGACDAGSRHPRSVGTRRAPVRTAARVRSESGNQSDRTRAPTPGIGTVTAP